MPFISLLIPTFNSLPLAKQSIHSCLMQTFNDFELLVGDDSTSHIVSSYIISIQDTRLTYYHNMPQLGPSANWNFLISKASGTYIKLLHHDDYFSSPYALSHLVSSIKLNSCPNIIFNSYHHVDHLGLLSGSRIISSYDTTALQSNPLSLLVHNFLGPPSNLTWHRSLSLYFDESLKWYVDVDFYIRALRSNQLLLLEEPIISCSYNLPSQISRDYEHNYSLQGHEFLSLYSSYSGKKIHLWVLVSFAFRIMSRSFYELVSTLSDMPKLLFLERVLLYTCAFLVYQLRAFTASFLSIRMRRLSAYR